MVEYDGEVIAFYELKDQGDHVELLRMVQRVDLIGQDDGRMMWKHCVRDGGPHADHVRPGCGGLLCGNGSKAGSHARGRARVLSVCSGMTSSEVRDSEPSPSCHHREDT